MEEEFSVQFCDSHSYSNNSKQPQEPMNDNMKSTMMNGIMNYNEFNNTGDCKINGLVIAVNCCYSIGFSTTNNNKKGRFFCKHRY